MQVNTQPVNPSFGYSTILSKLYREGKLPMIKRGFYGDLLNNDPSSPRFATNEHLNPHSLGGSTHPRNIVLSSKRLNNARGNDPLSTVFNLDKATAYFKQFEDVKVPYKKGGKNKIFDGNNYIKLAWENITKLLKREKRLDLLEGTKKLNIKA